MKKITLKKNGLSIFIFLLFVVVSFTSYGYLYAQETSGGEPVGEMSGDEPGTSSGGGSGKLDNPLKSSGIKTLPELVKKIFDIVLMVGVPIVALAIIYTGFLFVKAQGNPDKLGEARKAFTAVVIGAAILLGSWVIAEAIQGTIEEIKSEVS